MRYQAALRPDRKGPCSANACRAASQLAPVAIRPDTRLAMELTPDLSRRVLLYSSAGHALMHLMTAFYAVIVLTLAVSWKLPAEDLLKLYAPATILLGVISLPAGWLSDRFGAPPMMVVMFLGLGLSSIAWSGAYWRHSLVGHRALRYWHVRRVLPCCRDRLGNSHRPRAGPRDGRERPVRRCGACAL